MKSGNKSQVYCQRSWHLKFIGKKFKTKNRNKCDKRPGIKYNFGSVMASML